MLNLCGLPAGFHSVGGPMTGGQRETISGVGNEVAVNQEASMDI
jgi:hypothetical protein